MQVGVGVRLRLVSGSMSNNFELFKEELNAGAGWGRGPCQIILNFSKRI